jgi:hypothetical protein
MRRDDRHVARTGEKRNAYNILARKPEGNRRPRRPRVRWEDNIKMDFKSDVKV